MAAAKEKPEHTDIGAQFRAAAARLGLSEAQVAERAGLSRQGVRKAFDGNNITLTTLRALAAVLHIQQLDFGPLQLNLPGGGIDEDLLRETASRMRAAAELVERLSADADRRAQAAERVKGIGDRAKARLGADAAGESKTARKR